MGPHPTGLVSMRRGKDIRKYVPREKAVWRQARRQPSATWGWEDSEETSPVGTLDTQIVFFPFLSWLKTVLTLQIDYLGRRESNEWEGSMQEKFNHESLNSRKLLLRNLNNLEILRNISADMISENYFQCQKLFILEFT